MAVLYAQCSLWEGYCEGRRCPRDTYPESYITKYTSIRRQQRDGERGHGHGRRPLAS